MDIIVEFPDSPLMRFLLSGRELEVQDADLLAAGEKQRGRIYERTLAGRDVHGKPFAPYSTKDVKRKTLVSGAAASKRGTCEAAADTMKAIAHDASVCDRLSPNRPGGVWMP